MENAKIYKLVNDVDNKIYIGSSTYAYLASRMNMHRQTCKDVSGRRNTFLYNHMREIGVEHFQIEILERVICENKQQLREREQYWIELLSPTYNMTKGGDGGDTSKSEKWLTSMQKYHSSKKPQEYATYGMLGKTLSEETKHQIGKANSYAVSCEGMIFASIKQAEDHFRSIGCPKSVRKRLDNPNHPSWFRIRPKRIIQPRK